MAISKERLMRKVTPWLFLLPSLFLLFLTAIYPFFMVWDLSLRNYSFSRPKEIGTPVGLENYRQMMHDSVFWNSLSLSLTILGCSVTIEFFIGLGLAMLLYYVLGERLRRVLTIALIVPVTMAPVVCGLTFKYLFQGDFGMFTYIMNQFGYFTERSILSSESTVVPAIILVDIWHWSPFMMLILLAGFTALPTEPYEAATIDGASAWMKFRHITVPLLKPLMGIAVILRSIDAFRLFDEIYTLTMGGPGAASETLMMHAYRVNFMWWDLGYGAAIGLFMFLIIALFSLFFYNLTKKVV